MLLTNILEQQGFSSLEARVYLATLELGQAPASQIARKIQENRVTVYSVLQNMVKKNQILTVTKNKVVQYSAISPKTLLKIAQEKVDLISERMPEFLALSTLFNDKPSVQFYEGLDGLKMLYEDMLNYPDSTIKSFLGHTEVETSLRRYLNNVFLPARLKRKIFAQVLMPLSEKGVYGYEAMESASDKRTEMRYISDPAFSLYDGIDMYGWEKVAMVMFGEQEMMWLIIKSKTLYKTLSSLFDLTWNRETHEE